MRYVLFLCVCVIATPALSQHMNAKGAPCQGEGSNAETGSCFFKAAKAADENLNKTYNQMQNQFKADKRTEDAEALRMAQRAWISFRDANCAAEQGLYGAGTGGPVTYWACMEANTRQRTEDLKTGFGWLLVK